MESHFDLDTALKKATGDHSSIHPKRTTMVAKKGDNDIEPENESSGWKALIWILGKGEILLQVLAARMPMVC